MYSAKGNVRREVNTMARTKIIPEEGLLSDLEYTSVIGSYSNGIDSTGALYWARVPGKCSAILQGVGVHRS